MLYYRRKFILALFEIFGFYLSSRRIQKILFLATRGKEAPKVFEFVPFKYGSFSFQAAQDLSTLVTLGYLQEVVVEGHSGYQYIGTFSIIDEIDMFDRQVLVDIKNKWGDASEEELIKFAYTRYPFYAINSTIAQGMLSVQEWEKICNQKKNLKKETESLFTIGYEGLTLEGYINKLILKDVHVLCDVRKNAFSMKFGFSKNLLQKACEGVGITYIHIPQLGIESEKRQELHTQADYNRLFDEYEQTTLRENYSYLKIITDAIKNQKRVALTCFENEPKTCHRSRVAKAVLSLNNKLPFENIM